MRLLIASCGLVALTVALPSGFNPVVRQDSPTSSASSSSPSSTAVDPPDACQPLQAGYGPVMNPDTTDNFLASDLHTQAATRAADPSGYSAMFKNLHASSSAPGYLGFFTLQSYDTAACANYCNGFNGCSAFNIYFERSPSIVPASNCSNPPSTNVIKCALYGGPVSSSNSQNAGQYQYQFQVAIAGSNGYVQTSLASIQGFTNQYIGNASIASAKDCNGKDTFLGSRSWTDGSPFNASRCAAVCASTTANNLKSAAKAGTAPRLCLFFNTFIQNKNNIPQGQYCAMYTDALPVDRATNKGQIRNGDVWNITYSFVFTNSSNSGSFC